MKLFYGLKDAQQAYLDNLTEADLDRMEKEGYEVAELREKLAAKQSVYDKAGETDLFMLDKYKRIPRDRDTDFFTIHAGNPPMFGKDKFYEKYENAEIVFPVVVQAAPSMYIPGDDHNASMIVLHGLDQAHKEDFETLRTVADLLVAMRDGEVQIPKPLKKLIKDLNNPQSVIEKEISGEDIEPSHFQGARFFVDTVYFSQERLPGHRIPNDRVIPMLDVHEKGKHSFYQLIRGQFYKKD